MKNDKVFWISIVAVIVVMVILVTQFAFRPHVIRLIKASAFQNPEEIATIVHRQLQEVFRLRNDFEFYVSSELPTDFAPRFQQALQSAVGSKSLQFINLDLSSPMKPESLLSLDLDRLPVSNERFFFWILPVPSLASESKPSEDKNPLCPSQDINPERFVGCLPGMEQKYLSKKKSWIQAGKWTATMTQFQMNKFVILVQEPAPQAPLSR